MRTRTWIKVCILFAVLAGFLSGQDMPLSGTVELKTVEDHYDLEKVVEVYIKEGATYKTENRIVTVAVAPKEYAMDRGTELKEYFSNISVYIALTEPDGTVSQEFLSYLNLKTATQQLFWDHAGFERADRAGESFGQNNPLTVKDEYIKVTLALTYLTPSEYRCDDCASDAASYIFIDVIRFALTVDYSQAQKDLIEEMQEDAEKGGEAQQYISKAQEYFQQGEFDKAREEFQKAKDVFDGMGDAEKSNDMQEWIDKCSSYKVAAENFNEGMRLLEEAAATNDYQEAINTYEEARSNFQRAKTEFDRVEDTKKSDECETLIERCNDEIDNLKGVGTLRGRLIYVMLAIAVIAGGGAVLKQLGKGKAPKAKKGITLKVLNAETGKEIPIQADPTDKIGKVRQLAATNLGVVPSALLYKGKVCPPDQTVEECGLTDGALVEVIPMGKPVGKVPEKKDERKEKLEKVEQRYREGAISKELYESLKKRLEE